MFLTYMSGTVSSEELAGFRRRLEFFDVADDCFSEILKLEGKFEALTLLTPEVRIWSVLEWYSRDQDVMRQKLEDKYANGQQVLANSISIDGAGGVRIDPSAYHAQQVRALGSAILMEAYRSNWFDSDGFVFIPASTAVSNDDVFKVGSVFFNANSWALFDELQEQVRFLGRKVTFRTPDEFTDAPPGFKFGMEFGTHVDSQFIDYVSAERNSTRESSNFFASKYDKQFNAVLDGVAKITGSFLLKEQYLAASSLSTLLNYDINDDAEHYSGLTLAEWVLGFCGVRDFCSGLLPVSASSASIVSKLVSFGADELVCHLEGVGLPKNKCQAFIDNITFHKRARDLFDSPLIKTAAGYSVVSDVVLSSVISRAIASNIMSRKGEFKLKGKGLEDKIKRIFLENNIEAVSVKKRYPDPEGEYEYDVLVLWDRKMFIVECKNRWLSEGRPVAIFHQSNQIVQDVKQVSRLAYGLKAHPEIVNFAFGREVVYDEIVTMVVGGLPSALLNPVSNVYFTDVSIISRFFSERNFNVDFVGGGDSHALYSQWASEKPSVEDFFKALKKPMQVAMVLESVQTRPVEMSIGTSIYLRADTLTNKDMTLDDYKGLLKRLS